MRVLRVAQKLYPDVKGGGPYHVHAMSRDQAAMGHNVTVLTVGDGPPREERDGYRVVRKPPLLEPLGNAISPAAAWFLRDTPEFDVVHAHSHLYFLTNLAALVRRLDGTPLAITNHGLYSQSASERVFDAYLQTLGRWTFEQADAVFTYTDAERRRLRDVGIDSDVRVVPNGIDTTRFTPDGPRSNLIQTDGPVVLYVGRFVDGKRPGIVLEAFADVLDDHPDATLQLCGEGPLEDDLRSLVSEHGMESAVTFLGHVPYDEMPAVYRSSDVLVLPSRTEGVPRTVLEAMASGVQVVVSDLEQVADLIEDNGRVVRTVSPAAFGDAIAEVLSNPDGSEAARERIVDRHTWRSTVAETTGHLESLAHGR